MEGAWQPDPIGRIIAFAILDPVDSFYNTLLHGGDDIIEDAVKFVCFYVTYRILAPWRPNAGQYRFIPRQPCLFALFKIIAAILSYVPINFLADELGGLFDKSYNTATDRYPIVIDIMGDVAEDIMKVPLYACLAVTVFMTIGETSP